MKCLAKYCCNKTTPGFKNIAFFRFPAESKQREAWLKFCGLPSDFNLTDSSRLCSFHFGSDDIYFASVKGKILKCRGALPTYPFVAQIPDFPSLPGDSNGLQESGCEDITMTSNSTFRSKTSAASSYSNSYQHQMQHSKMVGVDVVQTKNLAPNGMTSAFPEVIGAVGDTQATAAPDHNDRSVAPRAFVEERHSNSLEHERICAKTKTLYEKHIRELEFKCRSLQQTVKTQEITIEKQNIQQDLALNALNKTFNADQVDVLLYDKQRPKEWSNATITESLKTKFSCGKKGYEHERQKYPIPSERTLQRRMEDLGFESGILYDVLDLLRLKVNTMDDADLDCGIVFDEMSIEEARSYCIPSGKFYGNVTTEDQSVLASHALVFMLVGIKSRWKQVVAYHFTGNSVSEKILKNILWELIFKVEDIGCKVHFVTSDCAPGNKKLWNDLGLKFHKVDVLSSTPIAHPVDPERTLEIMPDVVHVFKSAVQGWVNNEVIFLSPEVVAANNLCTSEVNIHHIAELVNFEKNNLLKVASKLKPDDVDFKRKSKFDAMKVINSQKFVNTDVSAALRFYSQIANRPEVLTTAYFVECLSKWFNLSSNRSFKMALSKVKPEVYQETLEFLRFFKTTIHSIEVGYQRKWKPWQSSIILATNSILRLQDNFLNRKNYTFLLTGRLTQDCVESLFSQVRIRQKKPTALQFRNLLKSICISQYLTDVPGSSYDPDDREWLIDFPSNVRQLAQQKESEKENMSLHVAESSGTTTTPSAILTLNESERNVLYHISGLIIHKVAKKGSVCSTCVSKCISEQPFLVNFSKFTILKDFTGHALVYANKETFSFFVNLESIIRAHVKTSDTCEINQFEKIVALLSAVPTPHFIDCHNIKDKLIRKFALFRLKTLEPKKSRKNKFDSKSMAL